MKKNYFWSMLTAMLVAILSVGFVACDGDDPDPELTVSTTSLNLKSNGDGDKDIAVTASHTDWTVSVTDGSSWLRANKNGQLATVSVDSNPTTVSRTGKIKISATANANLSYVVTVTQAGGDGILTISTSSVSFDPEGGSQTIQVTSNAAWNVSGNPSWLTVNPSSATVSESGSESKIVTMTIIENSTNAERTCTLSFTTTDGKANATLTVTQGKPVPVITVNGTSEGEHTFPGVFDSGKSGIDYKTVFKIKSNIQWTLSGKEDWLNVSSISGNGDVDLTIYPSSENPSDKARKATITLSGEGVSVTITVIQEQGKSLCYVIPTNEVALYDRFCWEYTATSNANSFQYIILSEREYNRLRDDELLEEVKKEEVLKYVDGWLSMTGKDSHDNRITSNSTYYFISLATDKEGKYGALQKIKMTTPEYLNANQDAYVSFSNFENSSYQFLFDATKEGFCDTYHIIYGIDDEYHNSVVYAFVINYYLKYKEKHWLAKNDYYEWEIIENYPNNHTFSYTSLFMNYFPICFGYGWGVFKDGRLSSDLLGFQVDTSTNSTSQMRISSISNDVPRKMDIKRSEVLKRAKSRRK